MILRVGNDEVTIWGEDDAARRFQLLSAPSCSLPACHCGAVPAASGGAALYAMIACVGHDDVTIWGDGDALRILQLLGALS